MQKDILSYADDTRYEIDFRDYYSDNILIPQCKNSKYNYAFLKVFSSKVVSKIVFFVIQMYLKIPIWKLYKRGSVTCAKLLWQ